MFNLFAHAGEEHADTVASATHYLEKWYIALPVFFMIIVSVGYLTWLVSNRNKQVTLGVVTLLLLVIGFSSFVISPIVSVVAILLGLFLSLFAAFTSIVN